MALVFAGGFALASVADVLAGAGDASTSPSRVTTTNCISLTSAPFAAIVRFFACLAVTDLTRTPLWYTCTSAPLGATKAIRKLPLTNRISGASSRALVGKVGIALPTAGRTPAVGIRERVASAAAGTVVGGVVGTVGGTVTGTVVGTVGSGVLSPPSSPPPSSSPPPPSSPPLGGVGGVVVGGVVVGGVVVGGVVVGTVVGGVSSSALGTGVSSEYTSRLREPWPGFVTTLRVDDVAIAAATSAGVRAGFCPSASAATPATCGAAIDVPENVRVALSLV